jgi:hypothetical protein
MHAKWKTESENEKGNQKGISDYSEFFGIFMVKSQSNFLPDY